MKNISIVKKKLHSGIHKIKEYVYLKQNMAHAVKVEVVPRGNKSLRFRKIATVAKKKNYIRENGEWAKITFSNLRAMETTFTVPISHKLENVVLAHSPFS